MSEQDQNDSNDFDEEAAIEAAALDDLKNRATQLGVSFHPKIKAEALVEKIRKHNEELAAELAANPTPIPEPVAAPLQSPQTRNTDPILISRFRDNAGRNECEALVRCIVTCMDPLKKAYRGDFFTVGNSVMQTQTLMVPFGVEWHIPRILMNTLNDKYFTTYDVKKDHFGREIKTPRQVKAFAIQTLPDLTLVELEELRQRQIIEAGKGLSE